MTAMCGAREYQLTQTNYSSGLVVMAAAPVRSGLGAAKGKTKTFDTARYLWETVKGNAMPQKGITKSAERSPWATVSG